MIGLKQGTAKLWEHEKEWELEAENTTFARGSLYEGSNDSGFIGDPFRKALAHSYLGKTVDLKIDRPMGSTHPKHPGMVYPINYGYIPNVLGGDGEELDVYLLGVNTPAAEYTARIIGIVHRRNDIEDKLVAAPEGMGFTKEEIAKAVHFQEQYFESEIEVCPPMQEHLKIPTRRL